MSGQPTRRDLRGRLSDDDAADFQPLMILEGLSYPLQWVDQESGAVELETRQLQRVNARQLG